MRAATSLGGGRCSARKLAAGALTLVAALLQGAGVAYGQEATSEPDIRSRLQAAVEESEDPGWKLEEMRLFTAFYWQEGRGLQSQAGPVDGRGREDAWIVNPMVSFRVRQNEEVTHTVTVPVDIVSAASTDAIDLVSKASELNEAATMLLDTTYSPSETTDMRFKFGVHYEKPMRSFIVGPGFTIKLFEDNTIFGVNATVVADGFDPHSYTGHDNGFAARTSFGVNIEYLQVLSPTTLFDASAGTTEQWGVLQTTWNSVIGYRYPTEDDPRTRYRTGEIFPKSRNRNAFFARLSQHVPASRTTGKVSYRFYVDENAVFAHSLEAQIYQYLGPWLFARAHGRWHTQTAPDFWVVNAFEPGERDLRTSDSDLEELVSREAGLRLVFDRSQAPGAIRAPDRFDAGYLRYQRDNGLSIDFFSLGYARTF